MTYNLQSELEPKYENNDIRYQVGMTYAWDHIMLRRTLTEVQILERFKHGEKYGHAVCIPFTRCIGFVNAGEFEVAVMRHHWTDGRCNRKKEFSDHLFFKLEPVFRTETGEYIQDPKGVGTRGGVSIDYWVEAENLRLRIGYIAPEYQGVDWRNLVIDIGPNLVAEIQEGNPMISESLQTMRTSQPPQPS